MEISFQIWVIFTWSEPLLIPSLETVCFFCTSPWGKVNIKSKGFLGSTSHTSCCTFVPLSLHIVLLLIIVPIFASFQTSVGQVYRVDVSSKVEVVWADNSRTIVLPQVSN